MSPRDGSGWLGVEVPRVLRELYPSGTGRPGPRAWQHPRRRLTAFVTYDEIEPADLRWHISLRYGDPDQDGRVPAWEEIVQAAHDLRPGVAFAIGVPPRSWWMDVHPDVLHLWQLHDAPLLKLWLRERQGHRPS